jgi:hypothetical protein
MVGWWDGRWLIPAKLLVLPPAEFPRKDLGDSDQVTTYPVEAILARESEISL